MPRINTDIADAVAQSSGGTYTMPARCSNCGERFRIPIPLGQKRPTGAIGCPRCCCNEASVMDPAWSEDPPGYRPSLEDRSLTPIPGAPLWSPYLKVTASGLCGTPVGTNPPEADRAR